MRGVEQDCRDARRGASLVFVIVVVATLVSLALGAGVLARARTRLSASASRRAALRIEARMALFDALSALAADTNGVTHLGERWALDSAAATEALAGGRNGTFVVVEDCLSRLPFPECGPRALAALLTARAALSGADAAGLAQSVFAKARESGAQGALAAPEFLADLGPSPEARPALEAVVPLVDVLSEGKLNPNTAGRDVFVAAALGSGAEPGAAEGLWRRLERVRARGDFFASASPVEAVKLLRGEGDALPEAEIAALRAIHPSLAMDSDVFRVRAVARRGGTEVLCECVWWRGGPVIDGPDAAALTSGGSASASGVVLEWRER